MRALGLDQRPQRGTVGHRDDVGTMGNLVAGGIGVAVDGNDFHAQALQGDDDLLAEFAGTEQHDAQCAGGQGGAELHRLSPWGRGARFVEREV
ncbi:hypothetical protein SDC9_175920 [bioreactor metagenome]|uniref:Uncharacterized protein n=1 Tax=bioreactor metagenome TaxID=1076179 RepID=A0A645GNI3_9ZZZZ